MLNWHQTEAWQPDQQNFPFLFNQALQTRLGLAFYDNLSNLRPCIEQVSEHKDQE